jgi:PKD repeat protein
VEGEYSMTSENNPMGTHAHELGHDLGLPDLYDTNGGSSGIGHYGLMGSGSWCGPTHMTAWSKMQLGWLTPTIVTSNGYYDIRNSENYSEAYVLMNSTYSTEEYFLIENRWKGTSYDGIIGNEGDLDDEGIIIYHIDDAKAVGWWTNGDNNVNNDEAHKGVDVECADYPTSHFINADELDFAPYPEGRGDTDDLWDENEYDFHDYSTPCNSSWYNSISGMDVRDLPATGPVMRVALSIEDVWAPFADADGPYIGLEGQILTFNASGSYDLNGVIVSYNWDLDNDGEYDDASGVMPALAYGDQYNDNISLLIVDDEGLNDTDTSFAVISNADPIVEAGDNQTVDEGETVYFHGNFTDPGWLDTHNATWDWGDGSPKEPGILGESNEKPAAGGNISGSHTYCDNGTYTVTLNVTDDDGGWDTDILTITVNNVLPIVEAGPDQTVDEGDLVTFKGNFTDPGWCDTHTAIWDWDDGSPPELGTLVEENLEPDATGNVTGNHTYCDNGNYTVTLNVTDDDGGAGSDTLKLSVNNLPPNITMVNLTYLQSDCVTVDVEFYAEFTDPGWCDTHTAIWCWGDGSSSKGVLVEENLEPDATGTVTGEHTYTRSDVSSRMVRLIVVDDDGGTANYTYGYINLPVGGEILPYHGINNVLSLLIILCVSILTGIKTRSIFKL